MLMKTLCMIQQMSAFSISKLAANLNIDIGMAKQLVNQLEIMGHIKHEIINQCCRDCNGCSHKCSNKPIKVLIITEKGKKALNKQISA